MCLNGFSINLQVCAPTGAGKTNIAMISILHEVQMIDHSCVSNMHLHYTVFL